MAKTGANYIIVTKKKIHRHTHIPQMLELSKSDMSPPELLQLQTVSQILCFILYSTNHKLPYILLTFLIKYPRHNFVRTLYYTLTIHTATLAEIMFLKTQILKAMYMKCAMEGV